MTPAESIPMGGSSTKTLSTSPDESGMLHRVVIIDDVIGQGKRKVVSSARLIGSLRGGDKVVVKMLEERVPDEDYWLNEICKCDRLRDYVTKYCKYYNSNMEVHVEYPMTAYIEKVSKWMKRTIKLQVGEFVLVEESLRGKYVLFMTSSGKINPKIRKTISNFLTELMHYSYHISRRKELICGFQGTYSNGLLSLAEPTIHSMAENYRDTDLGLEGILTAFDNHRCTDKCRQWLTPEEEETFIKVPNVSVRSDIVPNGSVHSSDIVPNVSVHSDIVPNGSVHSSDIVPNGSVHSDIVPNGSVHRAIVSNTMNSSIHRDIVPKGSVQGTKILNGSVHGYKVPNGSAHRAIVHKDMNGSVYRDIISNRTIIGSISTTV